MPWDSVEVGLAGGEETANFGPRKEIGSSLYQVFSDKDYKPEVPSHNPCCKYLWDVKEPTHYS